MFVNVCLHVDTVDTCKSVSDLSLYLPGKLFCMKVHEHDWEVSPEKLPRIDEVNMLNLGLRKVKQETTAPQIISFHRTPQREKQKHRTRKGLRSPQHCELKLNWNLIHCITAVKKH